MDYLLILLFLFVFMPIVVFFIICAANLGYYVSQNLIEYLKNREVDLLDNVDENVKKKTKAAKDK